MIGKERMKLGWGFDAITNRNKGSRRGRRGGDSILKRER